MTTDRLAHHLKRARKRPEKEILRAICDYLKVQNHFFWRQNNTGVYRTLRNKKTKEIIKQFWTGNNIMRGVPDVFVMRSNGFGGVLYGIEVKSDTGTQRPEQKEFQRKFEANGGVYILARGVNEIIAAGF